MQMAHRSIEENGVTQISDPPQVEKEGLIDNLWYEKKDESTFDEKTQDPKFANELAALLKRTEAIKHNRTTFMMFPVPGQAIDAQSDWMSPTLALLMALARGIVNKNAR